MKRTWKVVAVLGAGVIAWLYWQRGNQLRAADWAAETDQVP